MWFGLYFLLGLLCGLLSLIFMLSESNYKMALACGLFSITALTLCFFWPDNPPPEPEFEPFVSGHHAGLPMGLWGSSALPKFERSDFPERTYLTQTQNGWPITKKAIGLFAQPEKNPYRKEGISFYFEHRHGVKDILTRPFYPHLIVLHSTEGESEEHAFNIFNRNGPGMYLGGVWTHFSVDSDGMIYQYGPLNRISKGQAGIDDQAVGIELVGHASLWQSGIQTKRGSLIDRFDTPKHPQAEAALDLVKTLMKHYQIPKSKVFSHEDIGHVKERYHRFPDYAWLRTRITDRVYLSLVPILGPGRKPSRWYGFLEPYDRQDPGKDVMEWMYKRLPDKAY